MAALSALPVRANAAQVECTQVECAPVDVIGRGRNFGPAVSLRNGLLLSTRSRVSNASLRLREVSQVGRLLSFLRRHQVTVRAQVIDLPADIDVVVALVAIVLRQFALHAAIVLHHRPRSCERIVDGGAFVGEDVGIVWLKDSRSLTTVLLSSCSGNPELSTWRGPFM